MRYAVIYDSPWLGSVVLATRRWRWLAQLHSRLRTGRRTRVAVITVDQTQTHQIAAFTTEERDVLLRCLPYLEDCYRTRPDDIAKATVAKITRLTVDGH